MNEERATHLLKGKTALITGGSRGIGSGISKTLAKRGANVIVNYFSNEASANAVVSEINTSRESDPLVGKAIAIQANVTDADQVGHMMDKIQETFGHVDILVNNAMVGRYFLKPFVELKWDDFYEKFYDEI